MSYFTTEQKRLEQKLKNNDALGPGLYQVTKQPTPTKAYAPFGSLSRKVNAVKNQQKNAVGPGCYQIQKNIIKPSVQQYQNQNCIIIKINDQGSSQFKSKKQRFSDFPASQTPGPGSYYSQTKSCFKKKQRANSLGGGAITKMKQLYHHQYKQSRKPTLLSDPLIIPEQQHHSQPKAKGVVNWALNRKERFHSEPKQNFTEDDKTIIMDQIKAEKQKKKIHRQSSFFASKSVKSCFDEIIYKSKNPYKVQLRKMFGFGDTSPGPGSYNLPDKKMNKKQSRFQFFGSTANRFSEQNDDSNDLGPGYYYNVEKINHSKPELRLKKPQSKEKTRVFTQGDDDHVGPGAYDLENVNFVKPSYNANYNNGSGNFGSGIPRFQQVRGKKADLRPEYISFMAQQDEERKMKIEQEFNYRRNILKNKKQPMFLSETKRNCFEDVQFKEKNPFGNYQVGAEDIATRLKKQKQYSQQFLDCNLTKPGFSSSVQRFKTEKQIEEGHKDCWCRMKEVQKKHIQHQSHVFNSGAKRTEVFQVKKDGPGVGKYSKNSSMIKDSFNSKFIKQNQNKTKKMKIWKAK